MSRWDACFIRLLDGLIQVGALDVTGSQLRVPTGIRRLAIVDPCPRITAGSEGKLQCCLSRVEEVMPLINCCQSCCYSLVAGLGGWVQTMPAGAAPVSVVISQAYFLIKALDSLLGAASINESLLAMSHTQTKCSSTKEGF